jgi:hypothetical protein
MAILRCGVKVIDTHIEGGIEQFISICIGDRLKETAERSSSKT